MLDVGDKAPPFTASTLKRDTRLGFPLSADCPTLFLFMGSGSFPPSRQALTLANNHQNLFADGKASFIGVTLDLRDREDAQLDADAAGMHWLLDSDANVSRLYKAIEDSPEGMRGRPYWLLVDSTGHVLQRAGIAEGARIVAVLQALLGHTPDQPRASMMFVPEIFEPALCRRLIGLHEADSGRRSGFTVIKEGVAVTAYDDNFKIRTDYDVTDPALRDLLADRLRTRLLPEIERAFQFRATRTERWLVTCYDGAKGGFLHAHRDNKSPNIAHRVISCTINLNAEDYEGGELRFPEYGARSYSPPTGGAIVFDSSLLHEVIPVRHGRRYAFVTFFYDEERARQRRLFQETVGGGLPEEPPEWSSFAPLSEGTT